MSVPASSSAAVNIAHIVLRILTVVNWLGGVLILVLLVVMPNEQWIMAAVGILHARLLRQRHRSLPEALEHEVLDIALLGEFDCGLDAIARIAGTGPYSYRSHIVSLSLQAPRGSQHKYPSAENCWHTSAVAWRNAAMRQRRCWDR